MDILRLEDVEAIYGQAVLALRGLSLAVRAGSVVALLGANGAGKSTTLKTASRLLDAERGQVTRGRILYQGRDVTRGDPADLVGQGVVQVLEGRRCFPHLTIEENLLMGASHRRLSRKARATELEAVYALFPRLRERRSSRAGYTSGGEQQMAAIGRALLARPKLLLLDEPSMGLAPMIVEEIFAIVRGLNRREGLSVLVAEQNAAVALAHVDFGYVIENGRVVHAGTAAELQAQDDIQALYLGGGTVDVPAARERPRRPQFAVHP